MENLPKSLRVPDLITFEKSTNILSVASNNSSDISLYNLVNEAQPNFLHTATLENHLKPKGICYYKNVLLILAGEKGPTIGPSLHSKYNVEMKSLLISESPKDKDVKEVETTSSINDVSKIMSLLQSFHQHFDNRLDKIENTIEQQSTRISNVEKLCSMIFVSLEKNTH